MLESRIIHPFTGEFFLSIDDKARINLPGDIVDTLKARNETPHNTESPLYYKVGSGEYPKNGDSVGFNYLELRDLRENQAIDFQNYRKVRFEKNNHRFCIGIDIADGYGFKGDAVVVGYGDRFYIFMKKDYEQEGFFEYFTKNYHNIIPKYGKFADALKSLVNLFLPKR